MGNKKRTFSLDLKSPGATKVKGHGAIRRGRATEFISSHLRASESDTAAGMGKSAKKESDKIAKALGRGYKDKRAVVPVGSKQQSRSQYLAQAQGDYVKKGKEMKGKPGPGHSPYQEKHKTPPKNQKAHDKG
jgi:hypothetical protein